MGIINAFNTAETKPDSNANTLGKLLNPIARLVDLIRFIIKRMILVLLSSPSIEDPTSIRIKNVMIAAIIVRGSANSNPTLSVTSCMIITPSSAKILKMTLLLDTLENL